MRKITVLLLILLTASQVDSQELKLNVKHVKGQKTIDIAGIATFTGFGGQITYGKYTSNKLITTIGVEYEQGSVNYTDYLMSAIDGGGMYTFAKITPDLYLHGLGLLKIGFENLQNEELKTKDSNFIFGVSVGLNLEYYITNKIGVAITAEQIIYMISDLGNQYPKFGVGIKFVL